MAHEEESGALVLFDGVCNLCNASVTFIIDRNPADRFRFASLQSEFGEEQIRRRRLSGPILSSLVLIEGGRCFTRSTAALRIARRLTLPWNLLYGLLLIPAPVRDIVYAWIARNRYRWFGKSDACRHPTSDLARRFLD
ncbi:MAG: DCC1-like thiol-disulfide oxidoreductase family protein [Nitrospinota bacterium]|jgi:predicted DCC family thiol-disulfide oxidoreductase YuxK|nr:DCC1-like thiol-disulfide oxidoreductase family protein [Nitrospinota bacterium]